MNLLFETTGQLYHLINDINYINNRNNVTIDMFKKVNQDNIDSIITQMHMDNSNIYLRYEQTGEIIEPETPENNRTVPTTAPTGISVGVPRGYPAVAPRGEHTHNIKAAIDELRMKINRDVPQTLADRNNFERMLNNTENLYNTNNNTHFIYARNNSIYNSFITSPNNTSDEINLIISNIIVENSELLKIIESKSTLFSVYYDIYFL